MILQLWRVIGLFWFSVMVLFDETMAELRYDSLTINGVSMLLFALLSFLILSWWHVIGIIKMTVVVCVSLSLSSMNSPEANYSHLCDAVSSFSV